MNQDQLQTGKYFPGKDFCEKVIDFYRRNSPDEKPTQLFIQELNNLDVNLQVESNNLVRLAENLEKFSNNGIVYSNNFTHECKSFRDSLRKNLKNLVNLETLDSELENEIKRLNVGDRELNVSKDDKETLIKYHQLKFDADMLKKKLIDVRKQIEEKVNTIESITIKTENYYLLVDQKNFKYDLSEPLKNINFKEISAIKKKVLDLDEEVQEIIHSCSTVFILILERYKEIKLNIKTFDQTFSEGKNLIIITTDENMNLLKFKSDFKYIYVQISNIRDKNDAIHKLESLILNRKNSNPVSSITVIEQNSYPIRKEIEQKLVSKELNRSFSTPVSSISPIEKNPDYKNKKFCQEAIEKLLKHLSEVNKLATCVEKEIKRLNDANNEFDSSHDLKSFDKLNQKFNNEYSNLTDKLGELYKKIQIKDTENDKNLNTDEKFDLNRGVSESVIKHEKNVERRMSSETNEIEMQLESLFNKQEILNETKAKLMNSSSKTEDVLNCVLVDKDTFKNSLNKIKNISVEDIKTKKTSRISSKKILKLQGAIDDIKFKYYSNVFIVILDEYDEIDFNINKVDLECFKGMKFFIFTKSDNLDFLKIKRDYEFIKVTRTTITDEKSALSKLNTEIEKNKLLNELNSPQVRILAIDAQIDLNQKTIDELLRLQDSQTARGKEHSQIVADLLIKRKQIEQDNIDQIENRLVDLENEKRNLESEERQLQTDYNIMVSDLKDLSKRANEIERNQELALGNACKMPIEHVEYDKKLKEYKSFVKLLKDRKSFIKNSLQIIFEAFDQVKDEHERDNFKLNNADLENFIYFIKHKDFVNQNKIYF